MSGIKGVSLIDGESRPYFQDIETVLNIQQRDSVSQGVWEILKTIPETFYAFEFQFLGTQAYIHKIHPGLILLVLTQDSLIYPDYCEAFTRLKAEFEANTEATLESFRKLLVARTPVTVSKGKAIAQAMVEEITEQNGQGGAVFTTAPRIAIPHQPLPAMAVPPLRPLQPAAPEPVHPESVAPEPVAQPAARRRPELEDTLHDLFPEEETSGNAPQPAPTSTTSGKRPPTPVQSSAPSQAENPFARGRGRAIGSMAAPPDAIAPDTFVDLSGVGRLETEKPQEDNPHATSQLAPQSQPIPQFQPRSQPASTGAQQPLTDWLAALNCLGQCAIHYLGRAVVANYWRASRPNSDWVGRFEIERSGQIKPHRDFALAHAATSQQQALLQDWAERFAERCGRVIRDFPQLAETQGLSPEQRQLLGL
ncbi:MAG: hypothetical protein HC771_11235 [Synechococcales cyanobacterium CRU_2_2]|nr:hypothetical protein [Synechococcales cyanobacterium CRU_2_2]